jgi:hypothetical protein
MSEKNAHVEPGSTTIASFDYVGDYSSVRISRSNSGDYYITHCIDSESSTESTTYLHARSVVLQIGGFDHYCELFYPAFLTSYPSLRYLGSAMSETGDLAQHLVQSGKAVYHILTEHENKLIDKCVGMSDAKAWIKDNEANIPAKEYIALMKAIKDTEIER